MHAGDLLLRCAWPECAPTEGKEIAAVTDDKEQDLLVVVELAIQPDQADAYARRSTEAFAATRACEGFKHIEAHRNQDAPEEFLILEKWAWRAHHERYVEWRRSTDTLDRLASICVRPALNEYRWPELRVDGSVKH
jgi:quinol monooxygenase YgiN